MVFASSQWPHIYAFSALASGSLYNLKHIVIDLSEMLLCSQCRTYFWKV